MAKVAVVAKKVWHFKPMFWVHELSSVSSIVSNTNITTIPTRIPLNRNINVVSHLKKLCLWVFLIDFKLNGANCVLV